jgi:hypothetical protein
VYVAGGLTALWFPHGLTVMLVRFSVLVPATEGSHTLKGLSRVANMSWCPMDHTKLAAASYDGRVVVSRGPAALDDYASANKQIASGTSVLTDMERA